MRRGLPVLLTGPEDPRSVFSEHGRLLLPPQLTPCEGGTCWAWRQTAGGSSTRKQSRRTETVAAGRDRGHTRSQLGPSCNKSIEPRRVRAAQTRGHLGGLALAPWTLGERWATTLPAKHLHEGIPPPQLQDALAPASAYQNDFGLIQLSLHFSHGVSFSGVLGKSQKQHQN